MKLLSAGIAYHDGYRLLVGRNTVVGGRGDWKYDLPKGLIEPGEDYLSAAIREFAEETDIVIQHQDRIKYEGRFEYTKNKDLELFSYCSKVPLKLRALQPVCRSFIEKNGEFISDSNGDFIPEIDAFEVVAFENLHKYLRRNMLNVLSQVFVSIRNKKVVTKHDEI